MGLTIFKAKQQTIFEPIAFFPFHDSKFMVFLFLCLLHTHTHTHTQRRNSRYSQKQWQQQKKTASIGFDWFEVGDFWISFTFTIFNTWSAMNDRVRCCWCCCNCKLATRPLAAAAEDSNVWLRRYYKCEQICTHQHTNMNVIFELIRNDGWLRIYLKIYAKATFV